MTHHAIRTVQIQALTAGDDHGGGAQHARMLARGLRECGVRATLLCTGWEGGGHGDYDEVVAVRPRAWPLLWRLWPLDTLPLWARVIRRSAAAADAVISLSPILAVATRRAWPRRRRLYAPTVLDRLEHPRPRAALYQRVETWAFRGAARVLLPTPAVRTTVELLYGPLRTPVAVCPLGVNAAHALDVRRTRAELGIPPDAKLLLTVGHVNENKGQRHIAAALARCAAPDWWWVLVGHGPDEQRVRQTLRGAPIAARTRYVRADRQVADWYAAADVLVAASRQETFGLAIAEALYAGRPVVLPRDEPGRILSPLAEAVEQFGLGATFRRDDQASLETILCRLLSNAELRQTMGQRAATFARENFSPRRYAQCALHLLQGNPHVAHERGEAQSPTLAGRGARWWHGRGWGRPGVRPDGGGNPRVPTGPAWRPEPRSRVIFRIFG